MRMSARQREANVGEAFKRDVANHQMTVLHDDGLYRHIRFREASSSFYWFDLVTWPHNLTINGDMGCWTLSRLEDMFEFFAGNRINPGYWDEKVRGEARPEKYSEALFRESVTSHIADHADEYPSLAAAVAEEIFAEDLSHEEYARELLDSFKHDGFEFTDTWEWNFNEHTHRFLWCCYAIQWGIGQYSAARVAVGS
jgi:hypothetical protein